MTTGTAHTVDQSWVCTNTNIKPTPSNAALLTMKQIVFFCDVWTNLLLDLKKVYNGIESPNNFLPQFLVSKGNCV